MHPAEYPSAGWPMDQAKRSSAEEKPCLPYWSSLQAVTAYASSVIRPIASAVHAGILDWSSADAPDWVSAEAPSVEEPMD